MVKQRDFESEKNKQISNFGLMSYGHFMARNGYKSTIVTQKPVLSLVDFLIFEE